MLEAQCSKCGEIFVPADETDLEHLEQSDGQQCGGAGQIMGEWHRITRVSCDSCKWVGTVRTVMVANEMWFCPICGMDESGLNVSV